VTRDIDKILAGMKETLDRDLRDEERKKGEIDAALKRLKELGLKTEQAAQKELGILTTQIERKEKEILAGIEELQNGYDW
jgi:predicted transcriptional regulator